MHLIPSSQLRYVIIESIYLRDYSSKTLKNTRNKNKLSSLN